MRVTFWGTRGSIAAAGPATQAYGGNTACVQVAGSDGTCLVLDAEPASGARRPLGRRSPRIDIPLATSHGPHPFLGFFGPFFRKLESPSGPPSATQDLRSRRPSPLPPLFPFGCGDLDFRVELHNAPRPPGSALGHPLQRSAPRTDVAIGSCYGHLSPPADHGRAGVAAFPGPAGWTSATISRPSSTS